jgi:hypothetical protein
MIINFPPVEVVLNKCYGGFDISDKAWRRLLDLGYEGDRSLIYKDRANPLLVQVIKELGKEASAEYSRLVIETIRLSCEIDDHDGMESLC